MVWPAGAVASQGPGQHASSGHSLLAFFLTVPGESRHPVQATTGTWGSEGGDKLRSQLLGPKLHWVLWGRERVPSLSSWSGADTTPSYLLAPPRVDREPSAPASGQCSLGGFVKHGQRPEPIPDHRDHSLGVKPSKGISSSLL